MSGFVLYEDDDWFVVHKPPFISTHGSFAGDLALQEWIELHLNRKLFVVSRLDKETSGVLLFAKNKSASALAQKIHEEERSLKTYYFLSHKKSKVVSFECDLHLDGKPSLTKFERIGLFPLQVSLDLVGKQQICETPYLYRAILRRGRTHQIRRHASHFDIPILGCAEYGGSAWPRLALHCESVEWPSIEKPLIAESVFSELEKNEKSVEKICPFQLTSRERRLPILTSVSDSYRLFQRGEYDKDFSIDVFRDSFLISVYQSLSENEERWIESLCSKALGSAAKPFLVFRNMNKDALKAGLIGKRTFESKELNFQKTICSEHNLNFFVNLETSAQPGWFLDHRDFRKMVANLSAGKRVLNLFSYSGGYGLAAAIQKCEVVFNVDSSQSACKLARENANALGLQEKQNFKVIEEDVMVFLEKQRGKRKEKGISFSLFDIVVCDPPTVGKSKRGVFQVEKEWQTLVDGVAEILSSDGAAFFCNNHQKRSTDWYLRQLEESFGKVTVFSQPLDFLSTRDNTQRISDKSFGFNSITNCFHGRFFLCERPRARR